MAGLGILQHFSRLPEFLMVKKSARSKHLKCGIDMISNLPDPLLSHILSLLPTKCAVATSVLSTRWKFLWTSIANLDFDSGEGYYTGEAFIERRNNFTHFVNRVLLLLDPPSIQKFRLKCSQPLFDLSYFSSWISVAFGRTVRELELSLMFKGRLELPLNRIYCNVVILKLKGCIHFNIPAAASVCFPSLQTLHLDEITLTIAGHSSVSFPNLKILCLKYVFYANEDSVHNLFSSCPVLDDLFLERDNWDYVDCFVIRIPSLTRLSLLFGARRLNGVHSEVEIDTPALQYLSIEDYVLCEYLPANNLSSLLQAKLRFDFNDVPEDCISIFNLIGSLSKVKSLSLLHLSLKGIRYAPNYIPGFHNLTWLELEDHVCRDMSFVIYFLGNIDSLKHLVMKGWECYCSKLSCWTEPLNVPKCLLSRITTISFTCVEADCYYQLELIRYFLKNAEALQQLKISSDLPLEDNFELLQKILMFPRGSRACQVSFA